MSLAEIQDNKWEVQAAKPQLTTVSAIGIMVMMTAVVLFFGWVLQFSIRGAFTDPSGGPRVEKTQAEKPKAEAEAE